MPGSKAASNGNLVLRREALIPATAPSGQKWWWSSRLCSDISRDGESSSCYLPKGAFLICRQFVEIYCFPDQRLFSFWKEQPGYFYFLSIWRTSSSSLRFVVWERLPPPVSLRGRHVIQPWQIMFHAMAIMHNVGSGIDMWPKLPNGNQPWEFWWDPWGRDVFILLVVKLIYSNAGAASG